MKTLFFNGIVITMEPKEQAEQHKRTDQQEVCNIKQESVGKQEVCDNKQKSERKQDSCEIQQAVLVEDGIITHVGSNEELLAYAKSVKQEGDIEMIDLEGNTMIPAFIDAHSHLSSYANSFSQVSLEEALSYKDILHSLEKFKEKNQVKPGGWIIANGYDHNLLKEKAHPDKALLDEAFPDHPVVLQHKSGHFGVFNSAAIKELHLQDPNQNGYLEENIYVDAIKRLPMPDQEILLHNYQKAMEQYASYGITTIQEGMMVKQMVPLYQMLLAENGFKLDVVGYPQIADADLFYEIFSAYAREYKNGFRLGGIKIILDGSPQGRTAWMQTTYEGTTDYYGVSSMTDKEVQSAFMNAMANDRQLLAHCNGDAATEQFLRCAEMVSNGNRQKLAALRPVMIHAQLLQISQMDRVRQLGIIPSFFVAHCYYWGDIHIKNFGLERASLISPAESALQHGILFTFHQDTPVIEPNMIETIWCAVNRRTKQGVLLGDGECISVMDALRAVTMNGAYQYGEEKKKGSIAKGKKADLVILSDNLLEMDPMQIRNVLILATYKSGVKVYEK